MKTPPPRYIFALFIPVLTVILFVSISVVSIAQSPLISPPALRWETDINVALSRAEQEQRPVFLHFVGNDCQPAQQMAREVFVQPSIVTHLNAHFVMVNINASENAGLAQKFSVTAIPTDLIIKPNGQLVHRRTGGITAERFSEYLAFLQKTLEQPTTNPVAAVPAVPVAPVTNPAAISPVAAAPQREPVSVPIAVRDPFAQQPPPAAAPPIVAGTTPPPVANPPADNPLRTIETTVTPMPVANQAPPAPPVQAPVNVTVPPPTVVAPAVPAAIAANEPALPNKQVVEVPLALEGFCPVTLCTEERWISGNPAYCTMYQGHLFRFSSPEALVVFAQNPAKYIPVAMGEDVVLMADRNKRVNGDRKFGAWFQERVFLFSNQETLNAFAARPEYYREIALKYELARKEQPAPIVY